MTGYGFVIDQRKCIGCHACTVACKSENEVPVGSFRTWVKYVEKGSFPAVRRHFTVLRCNHCDAAPCVEICPVTALHKRADAIVDLDRGLCIGCRACMQACPYDALYLNPDTGTAEKCHYCAHRTELGLEPACVSVCPEQAIVAGDAEDRDSVIAGMIRDLPTRQRKPEKETRPRVWYVDALEEALVPGSTAEPPQWLWADRRTPPLPAVNGFAAPPDLVTTLNVDHSPSWGTHIPAYLLTKNLAAGAMIAAPFLGLLGTPGGLWPETAGLFFLAATLVLLVLDLERPERFLKLLLHPNPRSWLVKGTWVLTAFGAVTAASLAAGFLDRAETVRWLRFADLPLAVLASGYSAFLFRQCRGRDLWLEPGLFAQLVLRAALLGTGLAILVSLPLPDGPPAATGAFFAALILAGLAGIAISQKPRAGSRDLRRARALFRGKRSSYQGRGLLVVAAVLAASGAITGAVPVFGGLALLAAAAGLFLVEKAWIEAGQEVPLS